MTKLILLLGAFIWFPWNCLAQNQSEPELQNKYWVFRDKFRKHFVKIGNQPGESMTIDGIGLNEKCWNKGDMSFGDVMAFQGEYLAVLATEYYLLKQSNADTNALKAVLNELYFAINAVERADRVASFHFVDTLSPNENPDGFFIRADVPAGMYERWLDYGDSINSQHSDAGNGRKVYYDTLVGGVQMFAGKRWDRTIPMWSGPNDLIYSPYSQNFSGADPYSPSNECYVRDEQFGHDPNNNGFGSTANEMSMDQLIGVLFGFKCVQEFVGWEVTVDPDGTGGLPARNFRDWTRDLTDGMMDHLTQTFEDIPYCDAETISHGDCNTFANSILFTEGNYCLTNPALGDKFVDRGPFAFVYGYPLEKLGENLTGNDYPAVSMTLDGEEEELKAAVEYAVCTMITKGTQPVGCVAATLIADLTWTNPSNPNLWRDIWNNIPDYSSVREKLANSAGSNMLIYLPVASETWTHQKYYALMDEYDSEWAEILWAVMNDSKPLLDPEDYEYWLSQAGCEGIGNDFYGGFDVDTGIGGYPLYIPLVNHYPFNEFTIFNSDSRRKGTGSPFNKRWYNGMDYMMLYNFYKIASNKYFANLPNSGDNNHYWNQYNAASKHVDKKCACISSQQFYANNNIENVHLTSINSLKKDLPFRFPDYKKYNIQIPEWLTHTFTIQTNGELRPQGDLIVCSSLTMVDSAGKLATDTNYSTTYTKSIIYRNGAVLELKGNGELVVQNNTRVIIEKDSRLIFQPGAKITLNGTNAVLEIQGILELKNGAIFNTLAGANGRGYVRFNRDWNNSGSNFNVVCTGSNNKFLLEGTANNTNAKLLEVAGNVGINTDWNLAEFKLLKCNAELGEGSTISSNAVNTVCSTFWMRALPNEKYNGLYICRTHTLDDITIDDARYGITFVNIGNQEILRANDITSNRTEKPIRVWGGGFKLTESYINGYSIANGGLGIDATGCNSYSFIGNSTIYGHRTNVNGFYPNFTSTAGVHYFGSNRLYIDKSTFQRHTNAVRVYGGDLQLRCNQIYDYKEAAADMFDKTSLYVNQGYNNFDGAGNAGYSFQLRRQNRLFLNDGYNNFTGTQQLDMAIVDINANSQRVANPNYNFPAGPDLNRYAVPAANNYFNTPNATAALVCAPRMMYRQYIAWGNPASTYFSLSTNTPGTGFSTSKDNYCTEAGIHNNIPVKNYTPKPNWSPFGSHKQPDPATAIDNTTGGSPGTVQLVQRIHNRVYNSTTPNYSLEMDSLTLVLESFGQPTVFHNDNSGALYTAYNIMHDAISRAVYDHAITVSPGSYHGTMTKALNAQQMLWNKAGDNQIFWSSLKFELIRDWAQLYRLAEHRSDAISKLNTATTYITEENDLAMIDKWKCVNNAELTWLADTVSYDTLIARYPCIAFAEPDSFTTDDGGVMPLMAIQQNNIDDENLLLIYPNPANGQLLVELKQNDGETIQSIDVIDIQGKVVLSSKDNSSKQEFNVSSLPSGIYIVKVTTDKKQVSKTVQIID